MLIAPYGGALVDLVVRQEQAVELASRASRLPSIPLSERALCDLEMLATGAFSPLDRFMSRADFEHVVETMRLASGVLFPIPIMLPVRTGTAIALDREVALRDERNDLVGVMTIEEIFAWDPRRVAHHLLGTTDERHPLVAEMQGWGEVNVSGPLRLVARPRRYDFRALRLDPVETRARLAALGSPHVVAFRPRSLISLGEEAVLERAVREVDGSLLLAAAVGAPEPRGLEPHALVRACRATVEGHRERARTVLAVLPLASRMAGPREAVWDAIIQRNHGADHVVIGPDDGNPGEWSGAGRDHAPDAASGLARAHASELGVRVIPFGELAYLEDEDRYVEVTAVPRGARARVLAPAQVREQYVDAGRALPAWFARPEVASILLEAHPPRHRRGACVWFTGVPGAGKSTTAGHLAALLSERGRRVTVLDGDVVRSRLSPELGFSKADRDTHVRRIGFIAAEVVRHGGIVLCAVVSPYRAMRAAVRAQVAAGAFLEVFVDTPLEVCARRDAKALYARARAGAVTHVTGLDDPYEPPERAELVLDTLAATPDENARRCLEALVARGFVG